MKPGGLDGEGVASGPGIPVAAITQQACLLWTIARGKGTGNTESKTEISFSQQLQSLTKGTSKQATAPPKQPLLGTSHHHGLGTERCFPWALFGGSVQYSSWRGTVWAGLPEVAALGRLTSRPLALDLLSQSLLRLHPKRCWPKFKVSVICVSSLFMKMVPGKCN